MVDPWWHMYIFIYTRKMTTAMTPSRQPRREIKKLLFVFFSLFSLFLYRFLYFVIFIVGLLSSWAYFWLCLTYINIFSPFFFCFFLKDPIIDGRVAVVSLCVLCDRRCDRLSTNNERPRHERTTRESLK